MAESEGIKEIVNQAAIQATMAVMMAFINIDAGSQPTPMPSHREPQRQRYSRPVT